VNKKRQPFQVVFLDINIKINYAIFAKMALKVSLGRIALLVNSGLGW
jgi:hypothetical protein